ncbi:regulator of G-protein signaling protein [Naegleria gruberi]|uniref:Regulator of G-protein signaling protein n=1 Tax=Naegleria gruberi TaxID=5762 RepID=D2UZ25_NAEGR|nr:regulator of G-protein signaling protein [Naegleria gruberi]EFC50076.1 regulator of G-protein signaling protein [Naegleria gruberi]|eukprot:XP_002682820.1 regulator of G-protein signaling protein [Naegleria gruberi strain NEG-M]
MTDTINSLNNNTIIICSSALSSSHDIISTSVSSTLSICEENNFDDSMHNDECQDNTLSSSSNDQNTSSSVLSGVGTSNRSTFSSSFTFDSSSDSLMLNTIDGYNRNRAYNKKQHISHQILPSKLHHEQCKLMKRDFSGACAIFLVRFRKDLDEEHDYVQRRIDLDSDDFEFELNSTEQKTESSTNSTLSNDVHDFGIVANDDDDNERNSSSKLATNNNNNNNNSLLTLKDILIDKNQVSRLESSSYKNDSENERVWINYSNPLFEEEINDFVNPLCEIEEEIPDHLLMFYHTCHYGKPREDSKFVSHLDSLTPADSWTEVINPLSLSGLCRTQTAQRELQQFMKHKITKLKDPLSTTSTFSLQKKAEKRKSSRASGTLKRMSIKHGNQPVSTNPITATLTSKEWQESVLEEEFKINVNLETEFEEFCNPLFEHETHNYLLPDGLKYSDMWKLVNEMKSECPPSVNKIIYTRSNWLELEENNFKQKLNKILSIGTHQGHARTSSSTTRSEFERRRPETRRYTQLNQEPERRDTIVEETNVIHIEKIKLTVDGESIFNYLKKKAQGYLTDTDIVELLSFILDTQRKNVNGCRDISNNLVLLSPVPYNAYEYLEFSPNTIYRYVDNDNPVFYNGQILNVIPEKKKASLLSEGELISNLFHKGSVPLEAINAISIPQDSAFLLDAPTYTIKLLIILENLMAIIQKEYFLVSEQAIDYYSFKQSENYKLTIRYTSMLRNFDPIKLDRNQKKSFFINLHNLMLAHAFCEKKYIAIEEEYEKFYNEPNYLIGRYKLSMSDIMNYILREQQLPEWKFYLREYQLNFLEKQYSYDSFSSQFDPRIHFIISDGRKSSPLPQAIDQLTMERIIESSTKRYINENFACTESSIELPALFHQYKEDFSPVNGSIFGVLNFILKHLRKSNQAPFFELLKKSNITETQLDYYANLPVNNLQNFPILAFQVIYSPVDFSSNCLMFEQFVGNDTSKPISFEEVLRNTNYRSYLRAFSEIECSTENIEFYDHVEKYKTITDMEARWKFAQKMYDKFLVSDSPSEVNVNKRLISTAARQIFRTKGEDETFVKLPLDLFDRLNKEVEMVLFDTYSRFTNTEAYQNLVMSSRRKTAANASMASGSVGASFLLSNKSKFTESIFDLINSSSLTTPNSAMSNTNLDSDLSPFGTSSSPTSSSTETSPRPPFERKMSKIGLLAQVFERNEQTDGQSNNLQTQQIKPAAVSPRLQSLMEVFSNGNADSNDLISRRRLSSASTDSLMSTSSNVSTTSSKH